MLLCSGSGSHHTGSGLGGTTGSSHHVVSSHHHTSSVPSGTSPSQGSGTGPPSTVSGGQQHHGYTATPNNSAIHHNNSHHGHGHHGHGPVTQAQAMSQAQAAHQAVSQALSHAESGTGSTIHPTPQSQPVEFNHAINYVNKIKVTKYPHCKCVREQDTFCTYQPNTWIQKIQLSCVRCYQWTMASSLLFIFINILLFVKWTK